MEFRTQKKLSLLDSAKEALTHVKNYIQSKLNRKTQLLTPQDLKLKRNAILNSTNNSPEIEQDFRRTFTLYKNHVSNPRLDKAYQKYVNTYHKLTSLYTLKWIYDDTVSLRVFDTKNENKKTYKLNIREQLQGIHLIPNFSRIALLPNGELFWYCGAWDSFGIIFIINSNYKVRVLQIDEHCRNYAIAVYFNKGIYCFGVVYYNHNRKYDLDKNRWVKLSPIPLESLYCSSVIFNGNILIADNEKINIVVYSIDIDSYSIIPYNFKMDTAKLLINAERLYLIESNGFIHENEAGDEYSWKKIAKSSIELPFQSLCVYKKGYIYIMAEYNWKEYYKFDLTKKKVFKIRDKKKTVKNYLLLVNSY